MVSEGQGTKERAEDVRGVSDRGKERELGRGRRGVQETGKRKAWEMVTEGQGVKERLGGRESRMRKG